MNIIKKVSKHGSIYYENESGQYHREDGPAIEWTNGDKSWYLNGMYHREDGPAVECANGDKWYYLNGIKYSEQEFNNHLLRKRLQKIIEL